MTELTGPIKIIRAQSKAAYPYCHCLYVDGDVKAVFDTGAGRKAFAELDPESVDMVIYSHFHPDHTHGHELFAKSTYCIHALDYPAMVSREKYFYYVGLQLWDELLESPNLEYGKMMRERHPDPDFPDVTSRVKRIDLMFQEGDVFDFGKTRATVIHTPGHTPGHSCFFFEQEGVLFSGDIDLIPFGPWYASYLSNLDDFLSSIEKLKMLAPQVIVSCHRRYITENIGAELDAYRQKIFERESRVIGLLETPQTLNDLASKGIIYSDHPHVYYEFWEKLMLLKHLDRLEKMGIVGTDGNVWYKV
ncbi:MAG: MBL fold metallo-hydrolase [Syntrophothermus sp.]|uniref:MBL fold metallo-hydrolase n=1 Tax=Syntrophothermus sp. TaxID=2736299 RepID=UPI0025794BB8|nr:MBL fold metallo-hydrolase [Syntrophothermus sp.]NSW84058.1 MBL fold metallo-hydrolase [Syntrophothermus sp.]